jgi:hypothetical protein
MAVTDAFVNFGRQVFNRVLPPSQLDPVAILTRAQRRIIDPTFEPEGPRGRDILSAMRGRGDPLMTFNWYCELPILADNVQLGWEFVEDATLPFVEFEQISNYRAGKMYHYPGHYSLGTLNLKLFENSRSQATKYLDTWRHMILVPLVSMYEHPSGYKRPIKFTIFDVYKLTAMFVTYEKCWPMRIDSYNLQSAASERINPSVEFSADDVVVQFAQYDPNDIPSIVDNVTSADSTAGQTRILKEAARVLTEQLPFNI